MDNIGNRGLFLRHAWAGSFYCMGLMAALMMDVLKGTSWVSVVATAGLCIALVPIGIKVLKDGPRPGYKTVVGWTLMVIVLVAILYFIGQAG